MKNDITILLLWPCFWGYEIIGICDTKLWHIIISGWWYTYPSEKYEFVSWDDDSQLFLESHSKFHGSSHHQPDHMINVYHHIPMLFINRPSPSPVGPSREPDWEPGTFGKA